MTFPTPPTDEDRKRVQALKDELAEICHDIGCSMFVPACPGDPRCEILQKLIFPPYGIVPTPLPDTNNGQG